MKGPRPPPRRRLSPARTGGRLWAKEFASHAERMLLVRSLLLPGIWALSIPTVAAAATTPAPASAPATPPAFGAANYAVLGGYLAVLVAIGAYFSRREKTTDDYFLAGRRVPWWAAGLSIFGGGLSALTYMAIPALAFQTDWLLLPTYILPVAFIPVVTAFYIPFYRRLGVTTAYEYLEKRFNLPTRLVASAYFILFQFGRMAIMLYLPAIALATVTGLNVYACIAFMGVLATAYTVLGGVEAVIWTDVLQVIVLAGGAVLCLVTIAGGVPGGLRGIIAAAAPLGKFRTLDWTWDAAVPAAWVVLSGSIFTAVMPNTADQSVVQRYLITRDERAAKRAAWASALLGIPTGLGFFFLGTALFVFYKLHHAAPLPEGLDPSALLPFFVMQQMPHAVRGLVIAGIFAAAMSTIDNGMNAIATAVTSDFYRRSVPDAPERHYLRIARAVTLAAGAVATGAALWLAGLKPGSLFELFYKLLGLFGGTLGGLFVLGIFTRRPSGWAALVGVALSAAATCFVKFATPLHWLCYAGVGIGVCVGAGYVAGLLLPSAGRDLRGLTIHTASDGRPGAPPPPVR